MEELPPRRPRNDGPEIQYSHPSRSMPIRPRKKGFPWLATAGTISVLILVGAFVLSMVFSGATVTVHPRQQKAFVDGTFVASREAAPGQLSYELLILDKTLTKTLPANGEENVEERATGRITIYNEFDEEEQRLIKNTRFETGGGKIFRIQDSVTVPGATKKADGTLTPSKVEVTVFADEPGESYNVPAGRFTIPGFRDTPRYEKFYGVSEGPMAGGFIGKKKKVDEKDEAAARTALNEELKTALLEEAFAEGKKPEDYYLYKDATFFRFEEKPDEGSKSDSVDIAQGGTVYAVLLKKDQLAQFIASQAIGGFDNSPLAIRNPDELTVTAAEMPAETSPTPPWEGGPVSLTISGTASLVWTYDKDQLAKDLSGRDTKALETILSGFKGIEKATVVHRPFWKKTFPEDPKDIEVVESLD